MSMTLEEFMAREAVHYEAWSDWLDVRNAPKPDDRWLPPEEHAKKHPDLREFTFQGPTPEYERKKILSKVFDTRIREALLQGCWKVTGRLNSKPPRVDIEDSDVSSSVIRFAENKIGEYSDVKISRIATSPQSFLQAQIEAICVAVSPGQTLSKDVIQTILEKLFPDKESDEHFRAAWKDANIDPRWRKPGRRTGSKSNHS